MSVTLTPRERESLLERFDAVAANGTLNVVTRGKFRELAALRAREWILTASVDLSPQHRHGEAWEIAFKSAARDALTTVTDRRSQEAARDEIHRTEEWIREQAPRLGRGAFLVRSPEHALEWHASFPISLPTRVRLGKRAYVRPLARVRDEYERAAAVIIDKHRARLFVSQYGVLEEVADIIEDVPGLDRGRERRQIRFPRHGDAHVVWHAGVVAHATQLLLERLETHHLFVAGTPDILAEYREHLHPATARQWSGEFNVSIETPLTEVAAAVAPLVAATEAREETATIARLNDSVSADRGMWGLRSTLRAAGERRLRTLVVHDRYRAPGAECATCGGLYSERETRCPVCESPLRPLEDVVDALLEEAALQEAELELVRSEAGQALLPGVEPVGAILRF